ncbi:MAG: ABC transporter permease, partial [Nitrospinales bacterium]
MKPGALNLSQLVSLTLAECRGAWRRLIFFIVCLAIGVGAVMTINSFSHILKKTIQREAKSLLAADLEIRGSWEQNEKDLAYQKKALPPGTEFIFIKELKSMVRYPDSDENAGKQGSLLVELKAIPVSPPHFPFYGKIKTAPDTPLSELLSDNDAMVEPSFLVRTQLRVGDTVKLGDAVVRIRGEILAEPDRVSRSFSIGPRMMISRATLKQTGLIRPGSRVTHRTLIRLPENADLKSAVNILEDGLEDNTSTIRTYKQMQSSLTASVTRISKYLASVGVIALLMGGIGVAMIIRTFMAQKMDTIAIMNCLGAPSRTIFKIYFLQSFILGLAGSGLGVVLGFVSQLLLPSRLGGLLSFDVQPEFYWVTAVQSLLLGLFTTFLFSLWPLLRAIKTRPLRLFRRISGEEELDRGSRRERWVMGAFFVCGLILIVFWQAGSLKRATVFLVALGMSILLLSGATALALKLLRALPRSNQMTRRYGLANLYRPNNQAASIITALGMGIMLILTVRLVQMDMIGMLKENSEIDPPNYFFIDIQTDQKDKFTEAVKNVAPNAKISMTPLIRSKLYSADGHTVENWNFKNPREERFIRRDFVLTHMAGPLPQDNEIVQGKWWSEEEASQPQVSIEEDAASRLGVTLGSTLTMDIQGVKTSAPVTSI